MIGETQRPGGLSILIEEDTPTTDGPGVAVYLVTREMGRETRILLSVALNKLEGLMAAAARIEAVLDEVARRGLEAANG